jgi:hypothetical protein
MSGRLCSKDAPMAVSRDCQSPNRHHKFHDATRTDECSDMIAQFFASFSSDEAELELSNTADRWGALAFTRARS